MVKLKKIKYIGIRFICGLLLIAANSVSAESEAPTAPAIPDTPQSANIFAYPPDYFAVQLLAVKEKQAVLDFLAANDIGDPPYGVMYAKGKLWYVLLLGVYPDREAAEAAAAALPKTSPPINPWIRPAGQLQKAIRKVKSVLASEAGRQE